MSYKPYSVFTPEYQILSGGIRVMWGLLGWLLAKGQLAQPNVKWSTPFTAIYPEITHGNPLEAQRVIRYILNRPGVMSSYGVPGPTKFDPYDEIYVFSRIYDTFGVPDDHILFLPILNLQLFKDNKQRRNHTCYFIGKGRDMGLHPKDSIKIDRSNSEDQEKLANLLNNCTVMYTYENPTAMVEIARLCGCRVVFFQDGAMTSYTQKELTDLYEPTMMGVGWGKEVPLDTKKFREHYKGLIKTFEERLERFIIHTQI
jgi:hypothetical protein